jgi:nucleoside-diphosphate-sugar epimerase
MSRVLLTGATGLIGSRAIEPLLEAGHEVHAFAREPEALADRREAMSGVLWHRLDLLDPWATRAVIYELEADALLHFAWYAEHGKFWTAPENLSWVGATLGLLRDFGEAGGRRAVLAGSCAEYEWGADASCAELETARAPATPLHPATLYGAAKHATHVAASAYAEGAGLELAWGRIFLCYGPGEDERRLVPSVIRALLASREAEVGDGTQWRDLMHTDELARAFVALLDSPVKGPVNVASGEPVRLADVIALIAEQIGRPELVRLGALAPRAGDPPKLLADVGRLRREVGFHPKSGLVEGIEQTIRWWRERR